MRLRTQLLCWGKGRGGVAVTIFYSNATPPPRAHTHTHTHTNTHTPPPPPPPPPTHPAPPPPPSPLVVVQVRALNAHKTTTVRDTPTRHFIHASSPSFSPSNKLVTSLKNSVTKLSNAVVKSLLPPGMTQAAASQAVTSTFVSPPPPVPPYPLSVLDVPRRIFNLSLIPNPLPRSYQNSAKKAICKKLRFLSKSEFLMICGLRPCGATCPLPLICPPPPLHTHTHTRP
jgi:hypothetical protein